MRQFQHQGVVGWRSSRDHPFAAHALLDMVNNNKKKGHWWVTVRHHLLQILQNEGHSFGRSFFRRVRVTLFWPGMQGYYLASQSLAATYSSPHPCECTAFPHSRVVLAAALVTFLLAGVAPACVWASVCISCYALCRAVGRGPIRVMVAIDRPPTASAESAPLFVPVVFLAVRIIDVTAQ